VARPDYRLMGAKNSKSQVKLEKPEDIQGRRSSTSTNEPVNMGKMKMTYFGVRARAEISKLVMAYSNTDYEFVGVTFPEWPTVKPTIPTGSLPCMEIEGEQFGQGIALQSYLAEKAGIYGDNAMDRLVINQLSCIREDLIVPETQHFLCSDDAQKAEKDKDLVDNVYPKYLKMIDTIVQKKKGPYVLGDKFSLADIVVYEAFKTLSQNHNELLKPYKAINDLRAKVAGLKGIKEYLAKAPQTPM